MSSIIIPGRNVESLRSSGGGDFVFAEGAYYGEFEAYALRDLPQTKDGRPFAGYVNVGDAGERLSLTIGNISSGEGQPEPGNRKFFVDLVLRDGEKTVETVTADEDASWQLRNSQSLIGNLANALGAVEYLDNGDVSVNDGFVDALKSGFYNGAKIGFVIYHKANKKDPKQPYQEIETFVMGV